MLVRGVVRSAHGAALESAAVAFVSAPTEVPDIAALTDDRGVFALTAPIGGRYRLGVRADDHRYREVDVVVVDDVEVEIELEPEPPDGPR